MKYLFVILLPLALVFTSCGGDNAVSNAVDEASNAASDVANAAGDAVDGAANMAKSTADGAKNMAGDAADMANNAFAGMTAPAALASTVKAVKEAGGITKLSPDMATKNIDSWIGKLESNDKAKGVVFCLKELKVELAKDNISGEAVSPILMRLSNETKKMGENNMALKGLASALEAGAKKLAK